MKKILFIGRFQPFHLGHLDAIKQCLALSRKIIIGIGSSQYSGTARNPFSAQQRHAMILAGLRDARIPRSRYRIIEIPDIHDDARWPAHVEKLAGKFEAVMSGSKKVRSLFKKQLRHTILAPKFNLAISATEIRRRMRTGKAWKYLVPTSIAVIILGLNPRIYRSPLARG